MPPEGQKRAQLRVDIIKLRNLDKQSTKKRAELEENSLADAQQASAAKLDAILAAQNSPSNQDLDDLLALENTLDQRIRDEREVQELERNFQAGKSKATGSGFKKKDL